MYKYLVVTLVTLSFGVGCAAVKQAKVDYSIGVSAPLEVGEKTPEESASMVTGLVQAVPGGGPVAAFLAPLLVGFARIKRGQRIRKGLPPGENPITGALGKKIGAEGLVQAASTYSTAMMNFGGSGSGLKRVWKVTAATSLAIAGLALTIPGIREMVVGNPIFFGAISLLAGVFGGLEKQLGKVLPVKDPLEDVKPV